ncbi:MAG: thiolase, partial [Burkholderiales bacterium PBB4]
MKGVAIAGIGMTQFGKQVGRGVRSLALAAIEEAIADSGLASDRIDRIYFGNAISGIVSQQEMIRGQVALRHQALGKVPLFNIENACASG